jgi:hypothetical protein
MFIYPRRNFSVLIVEGGDWRYSSGPSHSLTVSFTQGEVREFSGGFRLMDFSKVDEFRFCDEWHNERMG